MKQGTFHQQGFTTTNISNKFDGDTDVLEMFGSDFKEELAVINDKVIKSDALDVRVSGPFNNVKKPSKPITLLCLEVLGKLGRQRIFFSVHTFTC